MKTVATIIMYVFFAVQLSYCSLAYAEYPQVSDFEELSTEEFEELLIATVTLIDWGGLMSIAESIDPEEYISFINSIDWNSLEIDPSAYASQGIICYYFGIPAVVIAVIALVGGIFFGPAWALMILAMDALLIIPALIFCGLGI